MLLHLNLLLKAMMTVATMMLSCRTTLIKTQGQALPISFSAFGEGNPYLDGSWWCSPWGSSSLLSSPAVLPPAGIQQRKKMNHIWKRFGTLCALKQGWLIIWELVFNSLDTQKVLGPKLKILSNPFRGENATFSYLDFFPMYAFSLVINCFFMI